MIQKIWNEAPELCARGPLPLDPNEYVGHSIDCDCEHCTCHYVTPTRHDCLCIGHCWSEYRTNRDSD